MNLTLRIEFYRSPAGRNPVSDYLLSLENQDFAFLQRQLHEIEEKGLSIVSVDDFGGGLKEFRISRHRFFFGRVVIGIVTVVHAIKKEGQKPPKPDVELARRRLKEFKARMGIK